MVVTCGRLFSSETNVLENSLNCFKIIIDTIVSEGKKLIVEFFIKK